MIEQDTRGPYYCKGITLILGGGVHGYSDYGRGRKHKSIKKYQEFNLPL